MVAKSVVRGITKVFVACLLFVSLQVAADDSLLLNKVVRVDIRAQALSSALVDFSRVSGVQIVAQSSVVKNLSTHGVKGEQTIGDALNKLLEGTGLRFHQTGDRTIAVDAGSASASSSKKDQVSVEDGKKELDTVYVIGTAEALTATRSQTPLKEIAQSVSVIDADTLRQQNAVDLASALQQATGITLVQNQSNSTFFYSRGFVIDSIHIDGGAPLGISLGAGSSDATSRDLSEFESIELLRGSDGLFGGNGNPGGTINLMRKQPTDTPQALFEASVGSWDTYRLVGDVSGPLNDDKTLGARLVVSGTSHDFFYNTAKARKGSAYGVMKYDFSPSTSLSVGGTYERGKEIVAANGLARLDNGDDPHLPRSLAITTPFSKDSPEFTEAFFKFDHHFNEDWRWRVNGTYLKQSGGTDVLTLASGPIDRTTGLYAGTFQIIQGIGSNVQKLLDTTLTGSFTWLGQKQEVMVGADSQMIEGSGNDKILYQTQVIDPYHFDPSSYPAPDFSPDNLALAYSSTSNQKQWGIFGAIKLRPIDGLAVTVGGRDSSFRTTGNIVLDIQGEEISLPSSFKDRRKFTPYGSVTYDLNPNYTIYASYADIFHTNNGVVTKAFAQLPDADGVNMEAGIKGAWFGNTLNASLAAFRIIQSGNAVIDPTTEGNGLCCYLTSNEHSKGFEAEVTGTLTENWTATAGYTYDIHTETTNYFVTTLPRNLFKLWTNYKFTLDDRRFQVGGGVRAQTTNNRTECAGLDNNGNCTGFIDVRQGFFSVADLRASYAINDHLSLSLNLNNIFDRVYYQTIYSVEFGNWYGAPRNFMLKLDGKF